MNPGLPPEAQHDAVQKVMQVELPSLLEENRRLHKLDRDANVEVFNAARGVLNPMVESAEEEGDQ